MLCIKTLKSRNAGVWQFGWRPPRITFQSKSGHHPLKKSVFFSCRPKRAFGFSMAALFVVIASIQHFFRKLQDWCSLMNPIDISYLLLFHLLFIRVFRVLLLFQRKDYWLNIMALLFGFFYSGLSCLQMLKVVYFYLV